MVQEEEMTNMLHQFTVIKKLEIDAGHRLHKHDGQCANFHGHRYAFDVYAMATDLDKIGRVIDFSVLKDRIGGWLLAHWDHGMLLWSEDPFSLYWSNPDGVFRGFKHFLLPTNPTAENLASYLLTKSNELLVGTEVRVVKVVCHETPSCSAIVEL